MKPPPKHILIIEDDPGVRAVCSRYLENEGYAVLIATEGIMGLEMAREHKPDLVLCDIMMQGLDGYDVLRGLRADPQTAVIPFVLMTGLADPQRRREGMNLGADDYLNKPFYQPDLVACVETQLRKKQALQQAAELKLEQLRASISMALPHEMRTPLSVILSGAELIQDVGDGLPIEDVQELAHNIHQSGMRLRRLAENFLIYAQVEMLARDMESNPVLMQQRLHHPQLIIERVAQEKAQHAGRSDDVQIQTLKKTIMISEPYLEKIFDELLDNALKFSDAGSPIKVEMREIENDLVLTVRDEGCGIPETQINNIGAYLQFERKMHEQQGTGLGLQIVKRLTELHQGLFQIESELDQGTTVSVLLRGVPATSSTESILLNSLPEDVAS
ncbi:MAG TPA: hybrid sensor histidine kinase/response regulator [Rhodothermales bacterium]|nr:hybrid sensor histidine kinase/response regulator [Rhodothermales bacterium]